MVQEFDRAGEFAIDRVEVTEATPQQGRKAAATVRRGAWRERRKGVPVAGSAERGEARMIAEPLFEIEADGRDVVADRPVCVAVETSSAVVRSITATTSATAGAAPCVLTLAK